MGKYRPSGKVIIGGQAFQTDAPIVNFLEGPRWDGRLETLIPTETDPNPFAHPNAKMVSPGKWLPYDPDSARSFTARCQGRPKLRAKWNNGMDAPYDAAKQVIRQFMIHHDGCATADMCFSVVQNERGLSCHFLCDNDGTIFQTLDLALEGWHGSELCPDSIGVELCNRGDALKEPEYYSRKGVNRPRKDCKIHGHVIRSYDFTPAQYESMIRLTRALVRLLPNLPAEYPQSSPGVPSYGQVPFGELWRFNGIIGHYHLTTNKWDPGPFDFKDFCQKIRGTFCFPLYPRGVPDPKALNKTQPVIPDKSSLVKEEAQMLYALNENKADGGFFPVGPWGEARLWHGGIHVAVSDGKKEVFAPFPGRLVAARMGPPSSIGSTNFVLLRHQMSLSERKLEFYSLYMHLSDAMKGDASPDWVAKAKVDKTGKPRELPPGQVWLLDEPIEAGQMIGGVGTAGPDTLAKAQIHLELFSIADLFEGMPGVEWETVDGTSGGRFCEAARINKVIDKNSDGILSRDELKTFFSSGDGGQLHHVVTRHVSEWIAEPSWSEALRQPKDFQHLKPEAIEALVNEQIVPGLWWTDTVATHCRLPPDGVVYHYNPVSFVRWLNEKLIDAAAQAGDGKIDPSAAREVPPGITDDRTGMGMLSKEVASDDGCNDKLTLKELVMGFDAPECK